MNCKYCGAELPVIERAGRGSHRQREYCSDAHRQAYFRKQHQQDQAQGRTLTALLSELAELREKVQDQEQEIMQLRSQLDLERRYLEDTVPRTFKAWLRKHPSSPLTEKLLADHLVPARGSRSLYEAHVRRLRYTEEEQQEFVRLWKLMLLSQA